MLAHLAARTTPVHDPLADPRISHVPYSNLKNFILQSPGPQTPTPGDLFGAATKFALIAEAERRGISLGPLLDAVQDHERSTPAHAGKAARRKTPAAAKTTPKSALVPALAASSCITGGGDDSIAHVGKPRAKPARPPTRLPSNRLRSAIASSGQPSNRTGPPSSRTGPPMSSSRRGASSQRSNGASSNRGSSAKERRPPSSRPLARPLSSHANAIGSAAVAPVVTGSASAALTSNQAAVPDGAIAHVGADGAAGRAPSVRPLEPTSAAVTPRESTPAAAASSEPAPPVDAAVGATADWSAACPAASVQHFSGASDPAIDLGNPTVGSGSIGALSSRSEGALSSEPAAALESEVASDGTASEPAAADERSSFDAPTGAPPPIESLSPTERERAAAPIDGSFPFGASYTPALPSRKWEAALAELELEACDGASPTLGRDPSRWGPRYSM